MYAGKIISSGKGVKTKDCLKVKNLPEVLKYHLAKDREKRQKLGKVIGVSEFKKVAQEQNYETHLLSE